MVAVSLKKKAAGQGLLGVTIPKAWGGLGKDYVSYALAIEAIARASATVAVSLSVTNSPVAKVSALRSADSCRFMAGPIPRKPRGHIVELAVGDKLGQGMAHRREKHSIGPVGRA